MGVLDSMKDMLAQYTSGAGAGNAEADFHKIAQSADAGTLAHGIAEVMRSGETPPFAQIVSQLFASASTDQKSAMITALVSAVPADQRGPLTAMLGGSVPGTGSTSSSAAPATMPSEDTVATMARRAEQSGAGVIEAMSRFYAQHPTLVKTLGTTAMVIAMRKIAEHHARNA
jgi:hypothetical protein